MVKYITLSNILLTLITAFMSIIYSQYNNGYIDGNDLYIPYKLAFVLIICLCGLIGDIMIYLLSVQCPMANFKLDRMAVQIHICNYCRARLFHHKLVIFIDIYQRVHAFSWISYEFRDKYGKYEEVAYETGWT